MQIETTCTKCGITITLDFGDMTKDEAIAMGRKLDNTSRECPGHHVELGGWWSLWQIDDAIRRAYDLDEGKESKPAVSDQEYLEHLLGEGKVIYDGGSNRVPELELPSIHDLNNLQHLGFGNFRNDTHTLVRCDSRGTRFYECVGNSA